MIYILAYTIHIHIGRVSEDSILYWPRSPSVSPFFDLSARNSVRAPQQDRKRKRNDKESVTYYFYYYLEFDLRKFIL